MEAKILKRAISGDSEALTILIDKYKDIAYNLALRIVKNEENAKDITHDSFLAVLENIDKFRNDSKFSTWLYRIVYNQSMGFIKKNHVKLINSELGVTVEYSEYIENKTDDYQELYEAIDLLDDNDKNVIMLFYLAEKSVKEISQITNLSNSNIKVILHRSRKKLKEKMRYVRD
jgi:RNA polymerase sigma factor (sigma-70 family)